MTPHAAFLAMMYEPQQAYSNLAKLQADLDSYGKGGFYDAVAVNANSKVLPEALKLVDFFAREGQSRLFAKVAGGISLHDANIGKFAAEFTLLAPMFKARKTVSRAQDVWPNAQVVTSLDSALIAVVTGQLTVEAGLKGMDAAWAKGTG